MFIGTSHFTCKAAADRYYRDLGYPNADYALSEGAIHIGPPSVAPGEILSVIPDENRYRIEIPEQPRVITIASLQEEAALLSLDGDKIVLPKERLHLYAQLKGLIEASGGRYNAKGYFTFAVGIDVDAVLDAIRSGRPLNGKKESQSFFTPEELGYEVCRAAGPLEGRRVLEPSAGHGALADIAEAAGAHVTVIENYLPNILRLREKGYDVIDKDFLTVSPEDIGLFDVIIANPPFSRNQDIDHILHMWTFLKPGAVLSAIASTSWMSGSQKKQTQFAAFLREQGAKVDEIAPGTFSESGTDVATTHIVLRKPAQREIVTVLAAIAMPTEHAQLGLAF